MSISPNVSKSICMYLIIHDDGGVSYQLSTITRNDDSIQKNIINLPLLPLDLSCAELPSRDTEVIA